MIVWHYVDSLTDNMNLSRVTGLKIYSKILSNTYQRYNYFHSKYTGCVFHRQKIKAIIIEKAIWGRWT